VHASVVSRPLGTLQRLVSPAEQFPLTFESNEQAEVSVPAAEAWPQFRPSLPPSHLRSFPVCSHVLCRHPQQPPGATISPWSVRESSPRMWTVYVAKTWKDAQEGRPESAPPDGWSTAAVMSFVPGDHGPGVATVDRWAPYAFNWTSS
jgi:hypothetical protein